MPMSEREFLLGIIANCDIICCRIICKKLPAICKMVISNQIILAALNWKIEINDDGEISPATSVCKCFYDPASLVAAFNSWSISYTMRLWMGYMQVAMSISDKNLFLFCSVGRKTCPSNKVCDSHADVREKILQCAALGLNSRRLLYHLFIVRKLNIVYQTIIDYNVRRPFAFYNTNKKAINKIFFCFLNTRLNWIMSHFSLAPLAAKSSLRSAKERGCKKSRFDCVGKQQKVSIGLQVTSIFERFFIIINSNNGKWVSLSRKSKWHKMFCYFPRIKCK